MKYLMPLAMLLPGDELLSTVALLIAALMLCWDLWQAHERRYGA